LRVDGSEWSAPRPIPGERTPGIHLIGGWMDTRASLDVVVKRKILSPAGNQTPAM